MDAPEIKLRCLELAMVQAKNEGNHQNKERVVEISTQFYNHIIESPEPAKEPLAEPEKAKGSRTKADKAPEIFK